MNSGKMIYKISVIITCYNTESTLKSCIDSVVNQTLGFENIELILYDDGSSDSTRQIIQDYARKFTNIVPYYSDNNSGFPGTGRNNGLELATSEYIMFIDSDDKYEPDICEKLLDVITNEKADVACCDKIIVNGNKIIKKNISGNFKADKNGRVMITGDDIVQFSNISVWNKIFKREIILKNNLKFPVTTSADDFAFSIAYFLKSKKLIYLKDYYGYIYEIFLDSISHALTKDYILEVIPTYLLIYETLKKENKEELMDNVIREHLRYLLIHASKLDLTHNEFQDLLDEILIFETKINFSSKLGSIIYDIINWFILNEKFNSAIFCFKLLYKLRNISILRKAYRFIYKI